MDVPFTKATKVNSGCLFLRHVYDRFNARDMETVLQSMQEDVMWANGMEGGYVTGREAVRSYWTRQWAMIDPHVEPVEFSKGPSGETVVRVHQVVHDLNGSLLADREVNHIFHMEDGLIKRFDIGVV
jgi:nuclear transport factor 2 (NTF2) superfamily protein